MKGTEGESKFIICWTDVDSSLISEKITANLLPKKNSVSLLDFQI